MLQLTYSLTHAGHSGWDKTLEQVIGLYKEIKDYCTFGPKCQLAGPKRTPKPPLVPLPVVGVPFERIEMDLVGPLKKSVAACQHILMVMDYATRYPKAIPLLSMNEAAIMAEFMKLFT